MSDEPGVEDPPVRGGSRSPPGRATRALIDLDAIAGNVQAIRAELSPGVGFMAVVKANAYGHGAAMVARAALAAGATDLAVATVDEGLSLRRAGIAAPILVLGPVDRSELGPAVGEWLALAVGSPDEVDLIARAAAMAGGERPIPLHLKLDTGMRRYGALPETACAVARRIVRNPRLELDGVFTHFADADHPDEARTSQQASLLDRCLQELAADGIRPRRTHAANSAGALRSPRFHYDLVRIGIALYGLPPAPSIALPPGVRPAMALVSRLGRVFDLRPGDAVGYGGEYVAREPTSAALVPIGYADGYRRQLSGRGWMGLGGRRAPVLGRVSMDQTVVAVPAGGDVAVGDEVVVMGDATTGAPTASDLAGLLETIPYEIVAAVAARIPRHYLRGGEVVAVERLGATPVAWPGETRTAGA